MPKRNLIYKGNGQDEKLGNYSNCVLLLFLSAEANRFCWIISHYFNNRIVIIDTIFYISHHEKKRDGLLETSFGLTAISLVLVILAIIVYDIAYILSKNYYVQTKNICQVLFTLLLINFIHRFPL